MIFRFLTALGCTIILFSACQNSPNLENDRAILLKLHKQQQTAHLSKDAKLFAEMFHDPIIQIKNGNISRNSYEATIARVQPYFDMSTFLEWEDITPPEIRISQDGTMAYKIVHKRVRLTQEGENGETVYGHSVFAWLETWEKIDGKWQIMAAVSTDRPGETDEQLNH